MALSKRSARSVFPNKTIVITEWRLHSPSQGIRPSYAFICWNKIVYFLNKLHSIRLDTFARQTNNRAPKSHIPCKRTTAAVRTTTGVLVAEECCSCVIICGRNKKQKNNFANNPSLCRCRALSLGPFMVRTIAVGRSVGRWVGYRTITTLLYAVVAKL